MPTVQSASAMPLVWLARTKMGVHGNATCVMNFDGAKGYLIGAKALTVCSPLEHSPYQYRHSRFSPC